MTGLSLLVHLCRVDTMNMSKILRDRALVVVVRCEKFLLLENLKEIRFVGNGFLPNKTKCCVLD